MTLALLLLLTAAAAELLRPLSRLLGYARGLREAPAISSEELRGLVAANTELGHDERELIADVFSAGERQLREVMVPRTEVTFLDADRPLAEVRTETSRSPHSRYPVVEGSYDSVAGFVHVRDLYGARGEHALRVRELTRPVKLLRPPNGCWRRWARCAGRATTWRSWWTSTAAPPASSPWRTWSRR